jgi:hypothetical protein
VSTSDAYTLDATDVALALQIDANNATTPLSGDTVNCRISYSCGDVLGDSSDDFDTDKSSDLVCVLNTYATDSWGEDPARRTIALPIGVKAFKLKVDAPQGNSQNIVVRAMVAYQRSA